MSLEQFRRTRERLNERILSADNLDIRRFFALDSRVYDEGALPARTKELLGLVASLVLRCDDCISYHVIRCIEEGACDDEIMETFAVGLVVGGSIVIPHLRRAVAMLDEARGETARAGREAGSAGDESRTDGGAVGNTHVHGHGHSG